MAYLANRVPSVADPRGPSSARGVGDAELHEVAAQVRGWRIHLTQLERGSCRGSVRERLLPSVHLVRSHFTASVAMHSSAVGDANPFQVGFIAPLPERLLWDGRGVRDDHLMIADGGGESNLALPKDCVFHVMRMDRSRVYTLTRVFQGPESGPLRPRRKLHRPPAPALDVLRSEMDVLMGDGAADRQDVVEAAERAIYERVALMLSAPGAPVCPALDTRRRVLRRAEEYMWAHVRSRISLLDLCTAAECSERTLRYVFRQRYGLSPMGLLKRLRLQGLRRDLLEAEPRSTTVLDLALRWGFFHIGHLGQDYKRFFGETPAATLARPPRAARARVRWIDEGARGAPA